MLRFPSQVRTKIIRQTAIPSVRSYNPEIRSGDSSWERIRLDLSVASPLTRFEINGTGLWLIRATNAAGVISALAEISLRPNGTGGWLPFRSGNSSLGFSPAFQFVEAQWEAFAGITATLMYLREGSEGRILNP